LSQAIANFVRLLADFPKYVVINMLDVSKFLPDSYYYVINAAVRCTECALHMHNLALAANRVHAMCLPFHYAFLYAKKGSTLINNFFIKWWTIYSNVYAICFLLWLLALCFGLPDPFFRTWTVFSFSSSDAANKACMVAAGLCYAALGCRLIWLKCMLIIFYRNI
jgi:hypothetical protein